jgi:hypothetical protein
MRCFTINGDEGSVLNEIFVTIKPYPHVSVGRGKFSKWVDIGNRDYHILQPRDKFDAAGNKLGTETVIREVGVIYLKEDRKHILVSPREEPDDKALVLLNIPTGNLIDCDGKLIVKVFNFKYGIKSLFILHKGTDVLVDRRNDRPSLLLTYMGDGKFDFDNSKHAEDFDSEDLEDDEELDTAI